jgi:hypothetical protein
VIQITAVQLDACKLQILEELVFVVDQMLKVAQKQGEDGFASLIENGGYPPGKIRVSQRLEPFPDTSLIIGDPGSRLRGPAPMIHFE